jgi:hypothetical protein
LVLSFLIIRSYLIFIAVLISFLIFYQRDNLIPLFFLRFFNSLKLLIGFEFVKTLTIMNLLFLIFLILTLAWVILV